ncbi:hypothetical protein B1C78_00485 [Thioalkalivibrio denitrificans]|uniref:UspA domain-containing protein n=1 Tax=Thioalkalivibrio denitrificans TaxID=108003 RepID=A0A1V3NVU3_9GAMM|nr:universal stress protein [Thioalkalivibrio denitrificans]OOG28846.1 hypothetical protein B1C78_00485 [Thioalkalivibrio denitrificans]
MFKQILTGYDGSEPALRAFALAAGLACTYGAALTVLAIARPPEGGADVETEAVIESSRQYHEKLLQELAARPEAQGVQAEYRVAVGHPAEQIIAHAEAGGADLIVIGHRGRGLIQRFLMGSISKQVVSHAPCAVLITK